MFKRSQIVEKKFEVAEVFKLPRSERLSRLLGVEVYEYLFGIDTYINRFGLVTV